MPSQPPHQRPRRIAVIGGGISGLAAAHRLVELDPTIAVTLFEAGPRLGGVLETVECDDFLIERSADNFITNIPWAIDLCRRIGFERELIPTNERSRQALVLHGGRLCKVPQGFLLMAPSQVWPILTTPILSLRGKLRLLAECFVPRREVQDESLASFVRRRFGRETFERLVQPLIGGIYTADPEKLSVAATLPRFLEMERTAGSLIRASLRDARAKRTAADSGARYSQFVTPRAGLSSLVEAIATRLPPGSVRLNAPVERIERRPEGGWRLAMSGAGWADSNTLDCDALIVATPSYRAASLLAGVDAELAADLERIAYAGSAVVALGYRREQIAHPLDAFGLVVPAVERRRILAASFSSVKYAGRAPDQQVLIRVFIGGACQSELLELSDGELRGIAEQELAELLGIAGEPIQAQLARWPQSMPQYHVGHCTLVERIAARVAQHEGLALAGNAYHGVGIPNCIHSGEAAAERLLV